MHVIAAKAVCLREAMQPEFRTYAENIVKNASALADALLRCGFRLVSGGTDNHLMLLDLRGEGLTGKELQDRLDSVHITLNKNAVPNDPQKPSLTSGVRIGTPRRDHARSPAIRYGAARPLHLARGTRLRGQPRDHSGDRPLHHRPLSHLPQRLTLFEGAPESLSFGLRRSLPLFPQSFPTKAPLRRGCAAGVFYHRPPIPAALQASGQNSSRAQKARQVSLPGFGVCAYFATLVR